MNLPFSVDVVLVAVVVAAHVDTRLAPSSTGHSSCLRRDRPQQLSGAPIFTPFLLCAVVLSHPNPILCRVSRRGLMRLTVMRTST